MITWGNVVNLSNLGTKQKSCNEMLDVIISKAIVNNINPPNFFPGPKILYIKSSNMGDALMSRVIRKT